MFQAAVVWPKELPAISDALAAKFAAANAGFERIQREAMAAVAPPGAAPAQLLLPPPAQGGAPRCSRETYPCMPLCPAGTGAVSQGFAEHAIK